MTIAELARRFTFEASPKNDMTPLFRGPTNPRGGKFVVQAHHV
jgi:hypothetical protein